MFAILRGARLVGPASQRVNRCGGSRPLAADFFSRRKKNTNKNESKNGGKSWPISSGVIAKQLVLRPVAMGTMYWFGAIACCGAATSLSSLEAPALSKAGIYFLTSSAAFSVGLGTGMISGATACLIEGRWLLTGMPLASAVDTLSKATAAEEETSAALAKAAEGLARQFQSALNGPQFVPRLLRPLWRVTMGAAVPFSALQDIPDRIVETFEKNPKVSIVDIINEVLLGVTADGLEAVKSRFQVVGLGTVALTFLGSIGAAAWIWPGTVA